MLKVSVKDFGPIVEGSVNLKPLTIFVGPSNSGKSYMAMLVYSLMRSMDPGPRGYLSVPPSFTDWDIGVSPRRAVRGELRKFGNSSALTQEVREWIETLDSRSGQFTEVLLRDVPKEILGALKETVDASLSSIDKWFSRELERCYGEISTIRRRGSHVESLGIELEKDSPFLKLGFEEKAGNLSSIAGKKWDAAAIKIRLRSEDLRLLKADIEPRGAARHRMEDWVAMELLEGLWWATYSRLLGAFPSNCFYLPAARSGIAQGHKAIASILIRQSSFAAIRPLEIPTLPAVITDFMGHILTMERTGGFSPRLSRGEIEKVVDFMEGEVVQGKIDIEHSQDVTYPEITYRPKSQDTDLGMVPLHRTSSMVSELAPVILFLKYLIRPEDLVILEEPESHLHPASQVQMARGIARLVNAGVKVIITTHSDYFLSQINNLITLSRASHQKRTGMGYSKTDCLNWEDVSAYKFAIDEELGGSVIQELEMTPSYGIAEETFADVIESLYEEAITLQNIKAK